MKLMTYWQGWPLIEVLCLTPWGLRGQVGPEGLVPSELALVALGVLQGVWWGGAGPGRWLEVAG